MCNIPENFMDLMEKKAFAHLATTMADGSPQVSPVWFEYDGTHIVINSAFGRVKDRNMRRNPRVAVAISDPDNPYRYLQVRGSVVEITTEGGDEGIDRLANKYMGVDVYPGHSPDETRVSYKIIPEHVSSMG